MSDVGITLPPIDSDTAAYWQGCRENRLLFQQCDVCANRQFYPRRFCTQCRSEALEWVASKGEGEVYSFTIVRRAANSYLQSLTPYVIALVDLDEGFRMMSNVIDVSPEAVRIGSRVVVRFMPVSDEIVLPLFTLAEINDGKSRRS